MVALSFQWQFKEAIEDGYKCRTIRRVRKENNPKAGDTLQLYVGLRTKECEKIADAKCTRVRPVKIDYYGVVLNGKSLYAGDAPAYQGGIDPEGYDGDFARADGFDTFLDMAAFFKARYGLPFEGQLIEWEL